MLPAWTDAAVVQVRLQLQNISGPGVAHKYKGPLGTIATIVREEGLTAPWKVSSVHARLCTTLGAAVCSQAPRHGTPYAPSDTAVMLTHRA